MPKEEISELVKFLLPYPEQVKVVALGLREFVWDLYPDCNELIYDNYNAVVFGWSPTDRAGDAFCSIAVYAQYINFGFMKGNELDDSLKLLNGAGSQYRYIRVADKEDFPAEYIKLLLEAAYQNSLYGIKPQKLSVNGQTIVKSVAKVKRRPGF